MNDNLQGVVKLSFPNRPGHVDDLRLHNSNRVEVVLHSSNRVEVVLHSSNRVEIVLHNSNRVEVVFHALCLGRIPSPLHSVLSSLQTSRTTNRVPECLSAPSYGVLRNIYVWRFCTRHSRGEEYTQLTSNAETVSKLLWCELDISQAVVGDALSFFSLAGDSTHALQGCSRNPCSTHSLQSSASDMLGHAHEKVSFQTRTSLFKHWLHLLHGFGQRHVREHVTGWGRRNRPTLNRPSQKLAEVIHAECGQWTRTASTDLLHALSHTHTVTRRLWKRLGKGDEIYQ